MELSFLRRNLVCPRQRTEMCLAAGPFVSITLFASLFSSKFVLFMSFVLLGAQSSFLSVVLTERPASLKLVMRDLCPYEVLTSHRHFFPLQVPFFTSRTEVPSPESLHCRKIFFSAEELLGRGDKFTFTLSSVFGILFRSPPPAPVCRVFCLALQAYQVRSGAFVSGIFLFPSRRVSSSRCPRTDAWKMS